MDGSGAHPAPCQMDRTPQDTGPPDPAPAPLHATHRSAGGSKERNCSAASNSACRGAQGAAPMGTSRSCGLSVKAPVGTWLVDVGQDPQTDHETALGWRLRCVGWSGHGTWPGRSPRRRRRKAAGIGLSSSAPYTFPSWWSGGSKRGLSVGAPALRAGAWMELLACPTPPKNQEAV